MILRIEDITSAVHKISDMVNGEKNIPGIMLDITDDGVNVCYSDGHRAFIEKLEATIEEGDLKTKLVFPYEQLNRAIANCQPKGIIKVKDIHFTVVGSVMRISADQMHITTKGEDTVERKVSTKTMDIPFVIVEETQDQKAKLLNRMNYASIFSTDNGEPDVWNRKKLISILNTMSFEKARNIYFSTKSQTTFVINSAFTCAIPLDPKELSQEDKDRIRGELAEAGQLDTYEDRIKAEESILHKSSVWSTNMAKVVSSILNRLPAPKDEADDKVFMSVGEGFVNIFNGDDTVGIYVEQAKGSRVHLGSFDRFKNFDYTKYQLTFLREFLEDSIKSAVNSSKNEKTSFTFKTNENGDKELVIVSQNAGASVSDTYNVATDRLYDADGDIDGAVITISLKAFADMLGQLKSDYVAIDISQPSGDQVCMRLSELNLDKFKKPYAELRTKLGLGDGVATPPHEMAAIRGAGLDTCQYSLITLTRK